MPRWKKTAKLKGKTVDFIEDLLPTSEDEEKLRETYKLRERQWKMIEKDKRDSIEQWKENYRKAKADELQKGLAGKEEIEMFNLKMTWLLEQTLTPEAFEWLDALRLHDPICCDKIVRVIIDNEAMAALDHIIRVVYAAGGTPMENRINLADLVKYWRKIKGISSRIMVKNKDGEEIQLSEYVRESADWRKEDD